MIRYNRKLKTSIEDAVRTGLTSKRKFLPSWLFYDKKGDALFREIMQLPEYYLTRCEMEILTTFAKAIAYNFRQESKRWRVIELGAGDGTKTLTLLKAFIEEGIVTEYTPLDISENTLDILQANITEHLPSLQVTPAQGEYLDVIPLLENQSEIPVLILFLGSNIGNFERNSAAAFLSTLAAKLRLQDRILMGVDLMKSPSIIEKAYHDYQGVTALFNKNILCRINNELSGNFDLKQFEHWPIYDAVTGACRSYLVSLKKQVVMIKDINLEVAFKPWETIYTEISQKYSEETLYELLMISNLSVEKMLFDHRRYFSLVLAKSIGAF